MEMMPLPSSLAAPRGLGLSGWSRVFASASSRVGAHWRAIISRAHRRRKALVVLESSPLGDRRLVSVIQFEEQRFLIGSSAASITLLARLPNAASNTQETFESGIDGGGR